MKRFVTYAIIVIVVAAIAGFVYLRLAPSKAAATTSLPTATVQRATLDATVNSAGNITAHQAVSLNFGQSGTVKKVSANVGDHVKAGDTLAELDTRDLELQVQNAQVDLNNAQAKLAQAKNPTTSQDIASARAKLESAQAQFDKLKAGPTAADLASAQAQVSSAQAAYDAAVRTAGTSDSQMAASAAALEKAQATLQQAQAAYDKVASRPDVAASSQALTLQTATTDYNSAKANYNALAATTSTDAASKVQQARASLEQARANLAKVVSPSTPQDLTTAQASVTQAKNDLDKLLAGADANALDIAQNAVSQAEIALKQAQLKLDQGHIVAPFDGVITAINITPGQNATSSGSTAAIQLSDLDHLEIVVNMAEIDINRIKAGQQAQVTLDALPDVTLDGQVAQIAPAGVTQSGVVNYPVTIALINPPEGVKTGMTANLNVVVDERQDVLTVPNRAVRTQGRQKLATVLFEGQQIQVPVQTGLSNDSMTEIIGGLKEGDTVLLTTTTTQQANRGGGFGGPPPGVFVAR